MQAFAQADKSTYELDIQADTLREAMQLLAADTGVQLLFSHDLADVTELNPVVGAYTIEDALEVLLEGSDLSSGLTKSGVIVISRRSSGEPLKREVKDSMKVDRKSLLGAAAAIALGSGHGALAQESEGAAEPTPERARTLDKITVTAERRAESLLDVPIAISAYSGERLDETGTLTVADLTNVTPSFQFGQDGAVSYIGMRGVSAGLGVIGAEGSVTVSQNGVTLGRLSLWDVDLFDIERVEVLRGPQGVINGRNSTGGAINIYSKLPTEEYEMGLQATFGNYNRFAAEGFMSGQIPNTNINGRIAFATDDADGWLHNTLLNQKINSKDKVQARATFVTDLSDQLDATLTLDAIRDRSVRGVGFDRGRIRADAPGLSEFLGVLGGDVDELTLELDQLHAFEKDQFGTSLKLQYDIAVYVIGKSVVVRYKSRKLGHYL